jgi:ribonuclease VapC
MIALDTSAVAAIALAEPEFEEFTKAIATNEAIIGTPTLVEARLVLSQRIGDPAGFLEDFIHRPSVHPVAFSLEMYVAAAAAFAQFGKGTGHAAELNFGDCMAYAVARHHGVPLLYKGTDFGRTDIAPALP